MKWDYADTRLQFIILYRDPVLCCGYDVGIGMERPILSHETYWVIGINPNSEYSLPTNVVVRIKQKEISMGSSHM